MALKEVGIYDRSVWLKTEIIHNFYLKSVTSNIKKWRNI
jgi:hypothetical protein